MKKSKVKNPVAQCREVVTSDSVALDNPQSMGYRKSGKLVLWKNGQAVPLTIRQSVKVAIEAERREDLCYNVKSRIRWLKDVHAALPA